MNHKTFNFAAVSVLVVSTVFLGAVVFWPDSPNSVDAGTAVQSAAQPSVPAQPVSPAQPAVLAQTDNSVDFEQSQEAVAFAEDYAALNTLNEFPVIEISSSDSGSSSNYASQTIAGDSSSSFSFDVSSLSSSSDSSSSSGSTSSLPSGGSSGASSGGSSSSGSSEGDTTQPSDSTTNTQPDTPVVNPGTSGGSGGGGGGIPETKPDYSLPEWIEQEGIRAGYLFYYNNPRYAREMKYNGLNTLIIKGYQFYLSQMDATIRAYQQWSTTCREQGMHLIAAFNWQPQEVVFANCRPVVFADGTEGLFACPLDDYFWQQHLTNIAVRIAEISVVDSVSVIDGIFLDMEMYRTEALAANKKNYSSTTCFCDDCFSHFIDNRTSWENLPEVREDRREAWLSQNGLLEDYFAYQTGRVEAKANQLKDLVHAINPKILFGVYPAITKTNWVLKAVMRAFGSESYPVISFSTDTYGYASCWGPSKIPSDIPQYFEEYDINGIYVAGYLFNKYSSSEIRTNIIQSRQRCQGYWLYKMPQLLEAVIPAGDELGGGTQADYLQAIKNANVW